MSADAMQSPRPYVFNRCYTLGVIVLWIGTIVFAIYLLAAKGRAHGYLAGLVLFPFFIPALMMALSWGVYYFPYSAFGPAARTGMPDTRTLYEESHSWIIMRKFRCSWPGVTWRVFDSGVAASIQMIGDLYLPTDQITSIERDLRGRCWIEHTSREFRSPIVAPSGVGDALVNQLGIS